MTQLSAYEKRNGENFMKRDSGSGNKDRTIFYHFSVKNIEGVLYKHCLWGFPTGFLQLLSILIF